MPTLDTLRPLYLRMSQEEQMELVARLRASRRVTKKPKREARPKAKAKLKTEAKPSLSPALEDLSPEEALELLRKLNVQEQEA